MAEAAAAPRSTRSSRFWLYAPFVLLVLLVAAWTGAWFYIRDRVSEGLDARLAAEARAGRQWTCADRRIAGFPFRIEVSCESLSLRRGDVNGSVGRVHSVAQVYQPRFVITEIDGPLNVTDGRVAVQGTWRLLETSVRAAPGSLQRASLVMEAPSFTVTRAEADPVTLSGDRVEAHLRPNPSRAPERALDLALEARQARLPVLDPLLGGPEPLNLGVDLTATQAEGVRGRPVLDEVERWRQAGGQLDVLRFSVEKGPRRLEARGTVRLDELHRAVGEFTLSAAGLDQVVAALTGNRVGGNLLGALLGGKPPAEPGGAPGLKPLPPIRLDGGRVSLGPFVVPSVRLVPLY